MTVSFSKHKSYYSTYILLNTSQWTNQTKSIITYLTFIYFIALREKKVVLRRESEHTMVST
jgi:hypothetical protein